MHYQVGVACVMTMAWSILAAPLETPIPYTASVGTNSVVGSNTAFALDLYQKLKDRPGNLFFSPYSISTALAMTYAGARGRTESEMASALHFSLSQESLHPAFGALAARMKQVQQPNRITLLTANSLWCQQDYHFTDAFLNVARVNYEAELRQVDFVHARPAALDKINQWVGDKTTGKITDLVAPDDLDNETRLVLCDAVYFKGKWQHQFDVGDTGPADFYISTNQTVTVPMMSQKANFKMVRIQDISVELLELPYSGNDLSMIIILPRRMSREISREQKLSDLEARFTPVNLGVWLARLDRMPPEEMLVRFPRFTTTQRYNLKPVLESMGMRSAFDETAANFSGMDGTTDLFISDVLHKAFVRVDEAGTEAAAATAAVMTLSALYPFIVDHPFIFLIRDNGSGTILFLGRIVDPTK